MLVGWQVFTSAQVTYSHQSSQLVHDSSKPIGLYTSFPFWSHHLWLSCIRQEGSLVFVTFPKVSRSLFSASHSLLSELISTPQESLRILPELAWSNSELGIRSLAQASPHPQTTIAAKVKGWFYRLNDVRLSIVMQRVIESLQGLFILDDWRSFLD